MPYFHRSGRIARRPSGPVAAGQQLDVDALDGDAQPILDLGDDVAGQPPHELPAELVGDVADGPVLAIADVQVFGDVGVVPAAAVVGGIYTTIEKAQKAMGNGFEMEYKPNHENAKKYKILYEKYNKLGEFIEKELTD